MDNKLKMIALGAIIVLVVAITLLIINPPGKISEPIQTPMEKVVIVEKVNGYYHTYKVKRFDKGVVTHIRIRGVGNRNYVKGDTIYWKF